MANYHNISIGAASFVADADLSSACAQYRFMVPASSNGKVRAATGASNPAVLGVLQNSPSAGQEAALMLIGPTKMTGRAATCNLVFGRYILSASDGVAEAPATGSGSAVCGRWLGPTISSGSAIGEAFVFPVTACHLAAS